MRVRLAFFAALACACACGHMQVPADLKSSEIPVDETPGLFTGNLRFGGFRAMDISKGWTHGGEASVRWFGVKQSETSAYMDYSFRFEAAGQPPRDVACRAAFSGSETNVKLFGGTLHSEQGNETLDCRFGQSGAAAPDGILRYTDAEPAGRFEFGELVFEVAPEFHYDGSSGQSTQPLGFQVAMKGAPVAAVDRNKTGVWMKRDLTPAQQSAAALASSILYLYRPQRPESK